MHPTLRKRLSKEYHVSEGDESSSTTTLSRRVSSSSLHSDKRKQSLRSTSSTNTHGHRGSVTIWEEGENDGGWERDRHSLAKNTRERVINQQKMMFKYQNQEHQLRKHRGKAGLIKLELDRIRVMKTPDPIEDETLLELEFLSYESALRYAAMSHRVESRRTSEDSSKTLTSDSEPKSQPPSSTRLDLHSEQCFACRLAARRASNISDSSNTSSSSTMFPSLSMRSSESTTRRSTKSRRLRRRAVNPDEAGSGSCSGSAHSSTLDSDSDECASNSSKP